MMLDATRRNASTSLKGASGNLILAKLPFDELEQCVVRVHATHEKIVGRQRGEAFDAGNQGVSGSTDRTCGTRWKFFNLLSEFAEATVNTIVLVFELASHPSDMQPTSP